MMLNNSEPTANAIHYQTETTVTHLSEPPSRVAIHRPLSNGTQVSGFVPIAALHHEIFQGGRGA